MKTCYKFASNKESIRKGIRRLTSIRSLKRVTLAEWWSQCKTNTQTPHVGPQVWPPKLLPNNLSTKFRLYYRLKHKLDEIAEITVEATLVNCTVCNVPGALDIWR